MLVPNFPYQDAMPSSEIEETKNDAECDYLDMHLKRLYTYMLISSAWLRLYTYTLISSAWLRLYTYALISSAWLWCF